MPTVDPAAQEPVASRKNVGELESAISLAAGVLLLVAALFPRSLKQLLLLGLGAGLTHRGLTRECGVYKALDIDTSTES